MKAALLFVLLGVTFAFAAYAPFVTESFIDFQQRFNKVYSTPEEYKARLAIFASNLERVNQLNAESQAIGGATFGITKFMDMTPEEFKSTILMSSPPEKPEKPWGLSYKDPSTLVAPPSDFDWRSKAGVVTPVYDQGQCGSCWAFSAVENIESVWALAGHSLERLSMQQVVSCDHTCYGCNGGWPSHAYSYVASAGGIDSYASYPYTATDSTCAFKKDSVVATVKSYTYATKNKNETEMASYLANHGPLSVCVEADYWMYYTGGIFKSSQCSRYIDHCVVATGYNLNAATPYWIIRNSWGTSWGMSGYMYLEFGKDSCGVAEEATSALV